MSTREGGGGTSNADIVREVACTEIGKKAWLFAKLQPGRAGKRINAT